MQCPKIITTKFSIEYDKSTVMSLFYYEEVVIPKKDKNLAINLDCLTFRKVVSVTYWRLCRLWTHCIIIYYLVYNPVSSFCN